MILLSPVLEIAFKSNLATNLNRDAKYTILSLSTAKIWIQIIA
jgi:hypothetical protein